MKQYTKNNKIEASGFQETQKMSYKVCAKSFQIIISSIYKNKEKVILSETGQNAFDAQRLAGRENQAFKVHLPCNMEPHYSIRDFGDSMDHNFMMNKGGGVLKGRPSIPVALRVATGSTRRRKTQPERNSPLRQTHFKIFL